MADIPNNLKKITPYVRRAQEVEKTGDPRAPLVAYACRTYAMMIGMQLASGDSDARGYLMKLMGDLEAAKQEHGEQVSDPAQCEQVLRGYALEQMTGAEDEFMSGQANKNTARKFYAAASFFEALAAFSSAPDKSLEEVDKKQCLFAKFRATKIVQSIKEGQQPGPTPEELAQANADNSMDGESAEQQVDEDDDDLLPPPAPTQHISQDSSDDESDEDALPPAAPTAPPASYRPPPARQQHDESDDDDDSSDEEPPRASVTSVNVARPPRGTKPRKYSSDGGHGVVSEAQKADAIEYSKFALRALQTEDFEIARKYLRNALMEIGE